MVDTDVAELIENQDIWMEAIHADDRARVRKNLNELMERRQVEPAWMARIERDRLLRQGRALLHLAETERGQPTEVGKQFYRDAVRVMHAATEAEANLMALSGTVTGHVTVGLMPTFTRAVLGPALLQFAKEFPNVKIAVREASSSELSRQVLAGELDLQPRTVRTQAVNRGLAAAALDRCRGSDQACLEFIGFAGREESLAVPL